MVSLGFGSCNLRAVLTGGDAGQAPVDAVCYASGLFRAPPFSLIDETRGSDRSVPVWMRGTAINISSRGLCSASEKKKGA